MSTMLFWPTVREGLAYCEADAATGDIYVAAAYAEAKARSDGEDGPAEDTAP